MASRCAQSKQTHARLYTYLIAPAVDSVRSNCAWLLVGSARLPVPRCVANVLPESFRARETETLIPAMIFGQGHSPGAPVLSLGTRLAVAL
jgi:hypothetical protein